jgi:hypothetical protein
MKDVRDVALSTLLYPDQLAHVEKLVADRDGKNLRLYLRSISTQLLDRGVVSDYLYYWLCYQYELEN